MNLKPSQVEVDPTPWERSHGTTPRGRGSWAFHPDPNVDACDKTIVWTPSMTFGEAKKYAKAEAAKRGWPFVSVLS